MKTTASLAISPLPRQRVVQPKSTALPDIKDWCLARADEWYARQDWPLAQEFLQHALDIDPHDLSVWIALGSVHYAAGNLKSAQLAFTHARELDQRNPEILLHLAVTHQQLENWAEAEWFFKQSLELAPNHIQALKLFSGFLMFRNRPQEARPHLERALLAELDDQDLLMRLGVCCFQMDDLPAARACFTYLLKLNFFCAMARDNLKAVENRIARTTTPQTTHL